MVTPWRLGSRIPVLSRRTCVSAVIAIVLLGLTACGPTAGGTSSRPNTTQPDTTTTTGSVTATVPETTAAPGTMGTTVAATHDCLLGSTWTTGPVKNPDTGVTTTEWACFKTDAQSNTSTNAPAPEPSNSSCPPGYGMVNGQCYKG